MMVDMADSMVEALGSKTREAFFSVKPSFLFVCSQFVHCVLVCVHLRSVYASFITRRMSSETFCAICY